MRTTITILGRAGARSRRGATFVRLSLFALFTTVACDDRDIAGPSPSRLPTSVVATDAMQVQLQVQQTGVECGCNKVGAYVDPTPGKIITATREGASPGNVYKVTATPIGSTISLRISKGTTTVTQFIVPSTASWGFSPDDNRFVYHYVSGFAPNQTHNAFVYNLAASRAPVVTQFQVATGASQIVFSPNGKYVLYSWLSGATNTSLTVVDAVTGAVRHQNSFTFQAPPGSPGNTFGMASWGFGPDANDRTLVYLYITGAASATWNVVNLTASSTPVRSESAATGFWKFSPCGDLIGAVRQTSTTQAWVFLMRTIDGSLVPSAGRTVSAGQAISFRSSLADHFVTLAGVNQPPRLAANTADDPCQAPAPTLKTLTVSPTSVLGGGTSTGTVTLSAAAPATGFVVTLSSANTAVATAPPNVTVSAGNTSATFTVQTKPVTASTSVAISAAAAGVTKTVSLTVTAPPQTVRSLSVTPPSLSFGNQQVGTTSAPLSVTVSSNGNAPVTIASIVASAPFAQTTNCPVSPATLANGVSCTVWVTFSPPSTGAHSGALTITSDAVTSPNVVTLSGTGYTPAAGIGFSSTSIDFGGAKLGLNPSRRALTLTSTGTAPLVVSSAIVGGVNPWDFYIDTDSCSGATLNPGATCTISMLFEPWAIGTRVASLTVAHNASGAPNVVSLTGVGVSAGPIDP